MEALLSIDDSKLPTPKTVETNLEENPNATILRSTTYTPVYAEITTQAMVHKKPNPMTSPDKDETMQWDATVDRTPETESTDISPVYAEISKLRKERKESGVNSNENATHDAATENRKFFIIFMSCQNCIIPLQILGGSFTSYVSKGVRFVTLSPHTLLLQ